MKNILKLLVSLLVFCFLWSCGDDSSTGPDVEINPDITVPLAIGNSWSGSGRLIIFKKIINADGSMEKRDTTKFSKITNVTGSSYISGKDVFEMQVITKSAEDVDTASVQAYNLSDGYYTFGGIGAKRFHQKSLKKFNSIVQELTKGMIFKKFCYPFEKGETWFPYIEGGDSISAEVVGTKNIDVGNKIYEAWEVRYKIKTDEFSHYITSYVTEIGIVREFSVMTMKEKDPNNPNYYSIVKAKKFYNLSNFSLQ